MAITTASQSQIGQETAKNSQIVTTSVRLINSGASTGPAITSVIVTDSEYNNLDDTAAATSNSYIRILGTGFQSTANVFLNGTMVPKANVTFVSSTELRAVLPVSNTGNYAVSVYNSNSSGSLYSSSFVISTMPQWLTSATLANVSIGLAFSTTLSATSDSNVTYTNTSILPAGTTLLSNGYFYGTISGNTTTYSFDVKATDAENQDTIRTFSLTTVLPSFTAEYLVIAGGGGGGSNQVGGGGGAGGLLSGSTSLTSGTSYPITVGGGGAVNTNGNQSSFAGINSTGGGGGSSSNGGAGQPGGSGGGGSGGTVGPSGNPTGGPGGSSTPGQGNGGGGGGNASVPLGNWGGGGGGGGRGGSGTPGGNATPSSATGGPGGAGSTWPFTGSTYAGGGGGTGTGPQQGSGGSGGGGPAFNPGSNNTGGGGGGQSGAGGSGVVILAVPTPNYPGSAPGATVTTPPAAPGKTVLTFTSSGTYTA